MNINILQSRPTIRKFSKQPETVKVCPWTCWSGICLSKCGWGKALILLEKSRWGQFQPWLDHFSTSSAAPLFSLCSNIWERSARDLHIADKQSQSLSQPRQHVQHHILHSSPHGQLIIINTSAPAISNSWRQGQFLPISLRNILFGIFLFRVSCVRQEPFTITVLRVELKKWQGWTPWSELILDL